MAPFRFRLQSLLKLRHSLEEAAQQTLARRLVLQDQAQAQLTQLRQTHSETVADRVTPLHQAVDLERWRAADRYLLALERRIIAAAEQLKQAQAQVAAARQELLAAHQAHLMLVRLKERRQEQHALEQLRDEAREMDEMAVLRHRIKPGLLQRTPAREVTP